MLDVRIARARIVDGSDNPWLWGDVGIREGRIVAVARSKRGPARNRVRMLRRI